MGRSLALTTATALLGFGLFAVPVQADEGTGAAPAGDKCTAAERRAAEAAGDNFADACLPGADYSRVSKNKPGVLPVGTQASSKMRLVANLPKSGAFAAESAFNSDLAFQGNYAYAGNYEGFTVYDIADPKRPRQVAQVLCPGSQNDISVYENLLVLSTDSSRSNDGCASTPRSATIKESWEGLKIFDISDPTNPQYVASVETPCGSHTNTLAPGKDGKNLWVYVSSYFPNAAFPDCQPPHDLISVVDIPLAAPAEARLAQRAVLFPAGGNPAGNYSRETSGCHDITAYPELDIAAGACMGDGVLLDISDREFPKVTETVRDTTNFAFWHSATFNNDGTKVVFTDELGGGGGATCNAATGPLKGANGIYDIVNGKLLLRSYYKIPRENGATENCVAHNGSLLPVPGKDIMVQAWYQGGTSVFDFTDSANPKEIAWFDRGPLNPERLVLGGSWSSYYYNGYVYSNDIQLGLDVFQVTAPGTNSKLQVDELNPQSQPSY